MEVVDGCPVSPQPPAEPTAPQAAQNVGHCAPPESNYSLVYSAHYVNKTRTEGTLQLLDGNGKVVATYQARSGSGKPALYTLPAGEYRASKAMLSTDKRFMRDDVGFTVALSPAMVWDAAKGAYRTGLYIHPCRSWGTAGCIGLMGEADKLKDFYSRISNILHSQDYIPVTVVYSK